MPKKHGTTRRDTTGWPVRITALVTLLLGLALLIFPQLLTNLVFNICGFALCAAGAFNAIRYFLRKDPYEGFNWELCLGLLLITGGVILMVFKNVLLSLLPLLFGLALLAGGTVKIQAALNMRRMMYGRWYLTLIAAAISAVLGVIIISNPFGTTLTLLRAIGAALCIEAVEDLLSIRSYKEVVTTYFVK